MFEEGEEEEVERERSSEREGGMWERKGREEWGRRKKKWGRRANVTKARFDSHELTK